MPPVRSLTRSICTVKNRRKGLLSHFTGMLRETSTQNISEAAHVNPL